MKKFYKLDNVTADLEAGLPDDFQAEVEIGSLVKKYPQEDISDGALTIWFRDWEEGKTLGCLTLPVSELMDVLKDNGYSIEKTESKKTESKKTEELKTKPIFEKKITRIVEIDGKSVDKVFDSVDKVFDSVKDVIEKKE